MVKEFILWKDTIKEKLMGKAERDSISKQGENNKYIHIEVLRILAIFFVIFNHTGNNGFFLFANRPVNSIPFWLYMLPSIFCKFSVPLFLMISGALMLERRNEALKVLWKNRIKKFFCILLMWSLIYYMWDMLYVSGKLDFVLVFEQIYTYGTKFHLYYLYIYLAFLISLPFLQAMVQKLETKYFYYMVGIAIFLNGILPIIEYLLTQGRITMNNYLRPEWLSSYVVLYPSIGYFLQKRVDCSKIKKLPLIWIINITTIFICCYMTYYKVQITNQLGEGEAQGFHSCFVLINCISIFCTIRIFCEKKHFSNRLKKFILSLGKASFGIYLIHVLVMNSDGMKQFLNMLLSTGLNDMICAGVYCVAVLVVSYGITLLLSKIPGVKWLVGY